MKWILTLGLVGTELDMTALLTPVSSQDAKDPPKDSDIVREKHYLSGWDRDEPVPAYFYFKKGNVNMPVVIFLHGMGGNKDQYPERMKEWARKGFFVVVTDAHLHGERKVPGIPPPTKNLGALGTNTSIWFHQSAVSHTARDVSKIIDSLAARSDVDTTRIGVAGISMGSSTCMVLAWKEPRISVVIGKDFHGSSPATCKRWKSSARGPACLSTRSTVRASTSQMSALAVIEQPWYTHFRWPQWQPYSRRKFLRLPAHSMTLRLSASNRLNAEQSSLGHAKCANGCGSLRERVGFLAIGDLRARKTARERQIFHNRRPKSTKSPCFFANIV